MPGHGGYCFERTGDSALHTAGRAPRGARCQRSGLTAGVLTRTATAPPPPLWSCSPPQPKPAAMNKTAGAVILVAVLTFCCWAVQLGGLAALNASCNNA